MDFNFDRKILQAVTQQPDGILKLRDHQMLREARLMKNAGWLLLTRVPGERSAVAAHLTDAGRKLSRLFQDDAVAQRLRAAFTPRNAAVAP
ncbi:MAG: hypothetical protein ABI787_05800 [Spartobacteria bacterium]